VKGLVVVALSLLSLAAALSNGWDALFRLSYTLLAAALISFLWAWGNVRWTRVQYELKTPRAQVGGQIEERISLENSGWLPKLWLEIRDHSTLLGRRGNRVVSLRGRERRDLSLFTQCEMRGMFSLGPITLVSGDPFGFFRHQRKLKTGGTVVVYPATVPLLSFGRLPGELPGGSVRGQRAFSTTPNASGVRDYRPGDALRSIHWLSSTRLRRLMVKEFDLDPLSDVWLVLDLDRAVQAGSGRESTEEWGVSVAASLANYFIAQHREVGLVTQGHILVTDRGSRQLHKILELLAVVHAEKSSSLQMLVAAEEVRFTRGATVVIITPTTQEDSLDAWQLPRVKGANAIGVLLDANSFGADRSSLPMLGLLGANGIDAYLVKRGDNLAQALAEPAAQFAAPGRRR